MDTLLVYHGWCRWSRWGCRPIGPLATFAPCAGWPRIATTNGIARLRFGRQACATSTGRPSAAYGLQTKTLDASANRPLAIFLNINTYEHVWEGLDPDLQEYAITGGGLAGQLGVGTGTGRRFYANAVTQPGARRAHPRPAGHRTNSR